MNNVNSRVKGFESHDRKNYSSSTNNQLTPMTDIIKVKWVTPWHGFGRLAQIEVEYEYNYSTKVLTAKKNYHEYKAPSMRPLGSVVLSPSKEKEIVQFLEDRANIEQFFESESCPDWRHESCKTLTIEDVDGRRHSIQLPIYMFFKHPFGFETEGVIKATWTSARSKSAVTPTIVMEYVYHYELSILHCRKKVYERENGVPVERSSDIMKLTPSKEKEIKLFFEDRANIKRFFEAESWQGSPEGTTILKIEDRTSSYAILLHDGDSTFKHPFGYDE